MHRGGDESQIEGIIFTLSRLSAYRQSSGVLCISHLQLPTSTPAFVDQIARTTLTMCRILESSIASSQYTQK